MSSTVCRMRSEWMCRCKQVIPLFIFGCRPCFHWHQTSLAPWKTDSIACYSRVKINHPYFSKHSTLFLDLSVSCLVVCAHLLSVCVDEDVCIFVSVGMQRKLLFKDVLPLLLIDWFPFVLLGGFYDSPTLNKSPKIPIFGLFGYLHNWILLICSETEHLFQINLHTSLWVIFCSRCIAAQRSEEESPRGLMSLWDSVVTTATKWAAG